MSVAHVLVGAAFLAPDELLNLDSRQQRRSGCVCRPCQDASSVYNLAESAAGRGQVSGLFRDPRHGREQSPQCCRSRRERYSHRIFRPFLRLVWKVRRTGALCGAWRSGNRLALKFAFVQEIASFSTIGHRAYGQRMLHFEREYLRQVVWEGSAFYRSSVLSSGSLG